MIPSHYQQAFYDWVVSGEGSAVIEAVAGSGKTTTIVEATKLIDSAASMLFVAFMKLNVSDLKAKLPAHVACRTLNSLGHTAWMRHVGWTGVKLDEQKIRQLAWDKFGKQAINKAGWDVMKLVDLAKGAGLVPDVPEFSRLNSLVPDEPETWMEMIELHDLTIRNAEYAISLARKILTMSIKSSNIVIDYNDQLYLPIIFRAAFDQYQWVFADELQDVNAIQRYMLRASLAPDGRFVGVGDNFQAIFGFRGSDSDSMARVAAEFNTKAFPLSICYRCDRSIVYEAQQYVPHIEELASKPLGEVVELESYTVNTFTPDDVVICRNTRPLVKVAHSLIAIGVPCRVLGREIGQGLVNLIKKMDAVSVDSLLAKLDDHVENKKARFFSLGQREKAAALEDKAETISIFAEQLAPGKRTIENLIDAINGLFRDGKEHTLTMSTIHKAKGREWDTVYLLDKHLMPSRYAKLDWEKEQERNLQYVARTRAKHRLVYITSDGLDTSILPQRAIRRSSAPIQESFLPVANSTIFD